MGAEGAIWRHELDHFAQSRQVIAIDRRSQGDSTVTPVGNTPEQRAEDLRAVLSAMHLARPPVLIGWSQGVQDLAAYLSRYGDHDLSGIVFVEAPISAGASDVVRHPKEAAEELALYDLYQKHQVDYLDGMWRAISRSASDAQRAEFVSAGMRTPQAIGVAELVADMHGADRASVFASIHKPALVIAASSSPDSAAERNMAAWISGASIVEISNASHALFLDQPAQFDTVLDAFLTRLH